MDRSFLLFLHYNVNRKIMWCYHQSHNKASSLYTTHSVPLRHVWVQQGSVECGYVWAGTTIFDLNFISISSCLSNPWLVKKRRSSPLSASQFSGVLLLCWPVSPISAVFWNVGLDTEAEPQSDCLMFLPLPSQPRLSWSLALGGVVWQSFNMTDKRE